MFIIKPIFTTLIQLLLVLGPALGLGLLMHYLSDCIRTRAAVLIGTKKYTYLTAPGVVVHEASHALFALIFLHKVTKVVFFAPDEKTGTLGYVNHTYNKRNLYQRAGNFFIGSAPIWGGCAVIALCGWFLLPPTMLAPAREMLSFSNNASSADGAAAAQSLLNVFSVLGYLGIETAGALFTSGALLSIGFYVFAYICFCIGGNMTLSPPDIKGVWDGGIIIVVVMLVFNFLMQWLPAVTELVDLMMSTASVIICAVMLLALVLNLICYGLLVLAGRFFRRVPA